MDREREHEATIKATTEETLRADIQAGQSPNAVSIAAGMVESFTALGHDCTERPDMLTACARWAQERIDELRREAATEAAEPDEPGTYIPLDDRPVLRQTVAGLWRGLELIRWRIRWNSVSRRIEAIDPDGVEHDWYGDGVGDHVMELLAETCAYVANGKRHPWRLNTRLEQRLVKVGAQRADDYSGAGTARYEELIAFLAPRSVGDRQTFTSAALLGYRPPDGKAFEPTGEGILDRHQRPCNMKDCQAADVRAALRATGYVACSMTISSAAGGAINIRGYVKRANG